MLTCFQQDVRWLQYYGALSSCWCAVKKLHTHSRLIKLLFIIYLFKCWHNVFGKILRSVEQRTLRTPRYTIVLVTGSILHWSWRSVDGLTKRYRTRQSCKQRTVFRTTSYRPRAVFLRRWLHLGRRTDRLSNDLIVEGRWWGLGRQGWAVVDAVGRACDYWR